jgi:hypothetical protein
MAEKIEYDFSCTDFLLLFVIYEGRIYFVGLGP